MSWRVGFQAELVSLFYVEEFNFVMDFQVDHPKISA